MQQPIPLPPTLDSITATSPIHRLSPAEFRALLDAATDAKTKAYCPYSKFHVGAALLLGPPPSQTEGEKKQEEDPTIVIGANVENASYPVGTCAERVALGKAVVEGYHVTRGFRAVAIATDAETPASPCGMCRQFIREFCDLSTPIIMFDKSSNFIVLKLEDLLPLSFGPSNLGVSDPAKLG